MTSRNNAGDFSKITWSARNYQDSLSVDAWKAVDRYLVSQARVVTSQEFSDEQSISMCKLVRIIRRDSNWVCRAEQSSQLLAIEPLCLKKKMCP